MAKFVRELLPGQTAEHLVGDISVAGVVGEMAARFTGRGGTEAAPVTAGQRRRRRPPRIGLQCQIRVAAAGGGLRGEEGGGAWGWGMVQWVGQGRTRGGQKSAPRTSVADVNLYKI